MKQKLVALSTLDKGHRGIITRIDERLLPHNIELTPGELERRLLEIGIIEGTEVTVLHFGLIRRDPIAIRLGNGSISIALRRNEAATILVEQI